MAVPISEIIAKRKQRKFRNNLRESKLASVNADEPFRLARRNLVWAAVLAILFSIAQPTDPENIYEFSIGLLGGTATFDRGLLAILGCLTLAYLYLRFRLEYARIFLTRLSKAAKMNEASKSSHPEQATRVVAKQFIEETILMREYTLKVRSDLEEADKKFQIIESWWNDLVLFEENYRRPLHQLHLSRPEFQSNILFFSGQLSSLEPFCSVYNITEFQRIGELLCHNAKQLASITDDFSRQMPKKLDLRIVDQTINSIPEKISSSAIDIENSISSLEAATEIFREIESGYFKFSNKIRRIERIGFNALDYWSPTIMTVVGGAGLIWWVFGWLSQ